MAQSNNQLSAKLANQGASMVPAALRYETFEWYKANRSTVLALCRKDEALAGLHIAAAFSQVNKIPRLKECTPQSLQSCIIHSMSLGLLPGAMKECAFIPFGREAVFVPMVEGVVKLMYQTGFVKNLTYSVVVTSDEFSYQMGDEEKLFHKPSFLPFKERGERIGAYCITTTSTGGKQICYRPAHFIESIRARSKGAKSPESPWNSTYPGDVDGMWIKTVLKQAAKALPKSPQLGKALALDNAVEQPELNSDSHLLDDSVDSVMLEITSLDSDAGASLEESKS